MDSETYDAELVRRQSARAGVDRPHRVEPRYPQSAMPADRAGTSPRSETADHFVPATAPSSGRLRAALLIIVAVIGLSAFAAIGWMQYQAGGHRDPQIEIGSPGRPGPPISGAPMSGAPISVPAMAYAAGHD